MKPYVKLECDTVDVISAEIHAFLKDHTDVLISRTTGWVFLDTTQILTHAPALMEFFKLHKLFVNDSAVTVSYDNFPLHVDPLPVVAKINFPVMNTQGWTNYWYDIDEEEFDSLPKYTDSFGYEVEDISRANLKLIAELPDMNQPMIFNSRIVHSVVNHNGKIPRIVASFTFHNEPRDLLK
jgi:hypothetical protein